MAVIGVGGGLPQSVLDAGDGVQAVVLQLGAVAQGVGGLYSAAYSVWDEVGFRAQGVDQLDQVACGVVGLAPALTGDFAAFVDAVYVHLWTVAGVFIALNAMKFTAC